MLSISILSLVCGTVFQVLTSKICLRVSLGRVLCLRAGLLSGMALQLVLITLSLSDVFRKGFFDTSLLFVRCLLLLPLRLWHLNYLSSWNSVVLYYSEHGFVINLLSAANSEMYEMICVVISELTFVWVLFVRSGKSVAFIEASLEELPVHAELGQSCLATMFSAPGPSLLGGSGTAGIKAR